MTGRGVLAILGSGSARPRGDRVGRIARRAAGGAGFIGDDPEGAPDPRLALVAIVAAVALRTGLIPFHVWAAKFMEGVSPLALPGRSPGARRRSC